VPLVLNEFKMPDERESDDSGGAGKGVRFVDTDLSINPSHKAAPDGLQNASADKYYKDVQSIHGDMVRITVLCVNIPAPCRALLCDRFITRIDSIICRIGLDDDMNTIGSYMFCTIMLLVEVGSTDHVLAVLAGCQAESYH